jgi:hypothetical protein
MPTETKPKTPQIIIEVDRGCYNLASPIPDGVELVIKDYDVIEDPTSPTQKNDSKGVYEEAVYTRAGNEGLANRIADRKPKGK